MNFSIVRTLTAKCAACEANFQVDLVLVIDACGDPERIGQLLDGTLNDGTCPNGHPFSVVPNVLIFDYGRSPEFVQLYNVAEGRPANEDLIRAVDVVIGYIKSTTAPMRNEEIPQQVRDIANGAGCTVDAAHIQFANKVVKGGSVANVIELCRLLDETPNERQPDAIRGDPQRFLASAERLINIAHEMAESDPLDEMQRFAVYGRAGDVAFVLEDWQTAIFCYEAAWEAHCEILDNAKDADDERMKSAYGHVVYRLLAYAYAKAGGRNGEAVRAMERGKVISLNRLLKARINYYSEAPFLYEKDREALSRYQEAYVHLWETEIGVGGDEVLAQDPGMEMLRRGVMRARMKSRADARAKFESLTQELMFKVQGFRSMTQFGSTSLGPNLSDILDAVSRDGHDALLYITDAPPEGLALFVHQSRSAGTTVGAFELPELTTDRLYDVLTGSSRDESPESFYGAQSRMNEHPEPWSEAVSDVLAWLRPIAERVADYLSSQGISTCYIVTCGHTSMLPWHAAFLRTPSEICWSYTPSALALTASRFSSGSASTFGAVAPINEFAPPLRYAACESRFVGSLFDVATLLEADAATPEAVYDLMRTSDAVHFATHGFVDMNMPLWSHIALSGKDFLMVRQILEAAPYLRQGRLAVLSACDTAQIGGRSPDEAIGFAKAFLYAGYAASLCAMWPLSDIAASILMVRFYDQWRRGALAPLQAFTLSQLWLSKATTKEIRSYLQQLVYSCGISAEDLSRLSDRLLLEDEESRPFADPVEWAAFAYNGV